MAHHEHAPHPQTPEELPHHAGLGALAMGNEVQYRTEHSRSVEDAGRYQAIETLKDLGVLVPVSDLDLYHGRASRPSEADNWKVDPTYRNGKRDNDNQNFNGRSTLYTADEDVAGRFARSRGTHATFSRLHKIVSTDADATVVNIDLKWDKMPATDVARYHAAIQALTRPPSHDAPGRFEDRAVTSRTYGELMGAYNAKNNGREWPMLDRRDIMAAGARTGAGEQTTTEVAAAINARTHILGNIVGAADAYVASPVEIGTLRNQPDAPVSLEYMGRFFREAHIVGVARKVKSATLGEVIDTVAFFDLEKTKSAKQEAAERAEAATTLQPIATDLQPAFERRDDRPQPALLTVLQDAHAKPHAIVDAAKQVRGYGRIFESSTGNWEGYTLEEHTGTVLRNFDENYADKVPVELLAPMRLALAAHDIGKPLAYKAGAMHLQKEYNAQKAWQFFERLGLPTETGDFLQSLIGEGAELAGDIIVKGRTDKVNDLQQLARRSLKLIHDGDIDENMVDGYVALCEMVVVCDGGAYTSMAVTRNPRLGDYRNAGSFDKSFHEPIGPGKRDLRLRNGGIPKTRP